MNFIISAIQTAIDYLHTIALDLEKLSQSIEKHAKTIHAASERDEQENKVNKVRLDNISAQDEHAERDRKTKEERQYRVQNSIRKATWSAFIAASIYAGIAALQWCATRDANQLAKKALSVQTRPWIGIEVGADDIRATLDEHRPPKFFSAKVHYRIHNYGSSPALRVAHSFVPAPDTGPARYPNEFACGEAKRISRDRFEIAASVFPNQEVPQDGQTSNQEVQVFPNTKTPNTFFNAGVIGCIAYIGIADSETHTTTIKILFSVTRTSENQTLINDVRVSYEDAE